jgi:hypothetical protein
MPRKPDPKPDKDEAARKARAAALRKAIANLEDGTDAVPGRDPSAREITDEAARQEAERENAQPPEARPKKPSKPPG